MSPRAGCDTARPLHHLSAAGSRRRLDTGGIEYRRYRMKGGVMPEQAPVVGSRPKKADVRHAILAAAESSFLELGYDATSLNHIARSAGYTKGAIYSNFGSKLELFHTVYQRRIANGQDLVMRVVERAFAETETKDELLDVLSHRVSEALPELAPWQLALSELRSHVGRDEAAAITYGQLYADRVTAFTQACKTHPAIAAAGEHRIHVLAVSMLALINVIALELSTGTAILTEDVLSDVFRQNLQGVLS